MSVSAYCRENFSCCESCVRMPGAVGPLMCLLTLVGFSLDPKRRRLRHTPSLLDCAKALVAEEAPSSLVRGPTRNPARETAGDSQSLVTEPPNPPRVPKNRRRITLSAYGSSAETHAGAARCISKLPVLVNKAGLYPGDYLFADCILHYRELQRPPSCFHCTSGALPRRQEVSAGRLVALSRRGKRFGGSSTKCLFSMRLFPTWSAP